MFRSISVLCGFAVGSTITVNGLNLLLDSHGNVLKASPARLDRAKVENSELELVLVQVLFRHGARTPLKLIPRVEEPAWDKNRLLYDLAHTKLDYDLKDLKNRTLPVETSLTDTLLPGGCRMGQLTVVGQQQIFDLGKNLKKLYNDELKFIGGKFDPTTTYLRTTHVPRTIDSLRCLVAGMFEDVKVPVTFWTLPIKDEFLFPNWESCGALRQYIRYCFSNAHKLPGYQQDLNTFFHTIGGHDPRLKFLHIFDNLSCRKAHNKPYPSNISHFLDTSEKYSLQFFSGAFLSPPNWTKKLILPLSVGKLAQQLYDNMKRKVVNNNPYKLYLYSVHDTSILTLLYAVGCSLDKWPPFASYIAVELYKNKSEEYFVRMLYCGKVVKFKSYNQAMIPLSQFEKIVSPYFINDLHSACQTVFSPPPS